MDNSTLWSRANTGSSTSSSYKEDQDHENSSQFIESSEPVITGLKSAMHNLHVAQDSESYAGAPFNPLYSSTHSEALGQRENAAYSYGNQSSLASNPAKFHVNDPQSDFAQLNQQNTNANDFPNSPQRKDSKTRGNRVRSSNRSSRTRSSSGNEMNSNTVVVPSDSTKKAGGSDPEKEFLIGTFQNMVAAGCDPLRYRTALCDYVSVAKCQYKSCFFHHIDDHLSKRTVSENAKECTQLLMYLVEERLEARKELQQLQYSTDRQSPSGQPGDGSSNGFQDPSGMYNIRQEQQQLQKVVNSLESECSRLQQQLEDSDATVAKLQQENNILRSLLQPVAVREPQSYALPTNQRVKESMTNVQQGLGNGTFTGGASSMDRPHFNSFTRLPNLPTDMYDKSSNES